MKIGGTASASCPSGAPDTPFIIRKNDNLAPRKKKAEFLILIPKEAGR
jgi:hypothetical protein